MTEPINPEELMAEIMKPVLKLIGEKTVRRIVEELWGSPKVEIREGP